MKKVIKVFALLSVLFMLAGCNGQAAANWTYEPVSSETPASPDAHRPSEIIAGSTEQPISISEIPAYSGNAYIVINNNIPCFTDDELSTTSFEYYSELDDLGRCGVCVASIGPDIMPTEERGEIGSVKPSGWHTVKYPELIDGNYLYNRCHLIGYQLTGENANTKNLITGTRYMNVEGMLPFEGMVADYVKETGNHVMYRVTPVFEGDNLVAHGVLIEAESLEDYGSGILFHVFCYNVQPGIVIDYATGDSMEDEGFAAAEEGTLAHGQIQAAASASETQTETESHTALTKESQPAADTVADSGTYAVNSNNGKIHITGACQATGNGDNAMKHPVYFDTYEEAESYSIQIAPSQDKRRCGSCWK